jgi:tight adherence protein B
MTLNLVIIFTAISLFVLSILMFFYWIGVRSRQQIKERLDKYTEIERKLFDEVPDIVRSEDLSKIPFLNVILKRFSLSQSLKLVIEQAGMEMEVGRLLLMMLVFAMLGFIITLKFDNILFMMISIFFTGYIPLALVLNKRRKRRKLFEQQFPDALDMLRNAIRAGFGLVKGIKLVADESPDPVGIEFRKTFEEINLGISMREALLNFSGRIDSLDLKLFITALLIQRESGGNLNEILFKIGSTIRERFKLIGQIRVFTAQGRLSGLILGLLPVIFGLLVSTINPDYIAPLFTEPAGRKILLVAFLMQFTGFIVIRRILKIKLI